MKNEVLIDISWAEAQGRNAYWWSARPNDILDWLEELILSSFVFKTSKFANLFPDFSFLLISFCPYAVIPEFSWGFRSTIWIWGTTGEIYRIFAVEWDILWYSEFSPAVEVFRRGSWDYPKLVLREELSQESFKKDTYLIPKEMPLFKMFFVGIGSWAIAGATISMLIFARIPKRGLLVAGITSDFSLFLE